MPSPTTPILDTFIRANENPLNPTNWAVRKPADGALKIVSNQCVQDVAVAGPNAGWTSVFTTDQEVYVTINTVPVTNTFFELLYRAQTANTDSDYYQLKIQNNADANWWLVLYKYVSGAFTFLGLVDIATPFVAGDQVWVKIIGSSHTFYYNGVQKMTSSDASITSGVYIGLGFSISCGAGAINFGGGSLGIAPAAVIAMQRQGGQMIGRRYV